MALRELRVVQELAVSIEEGKMIGAQILVLQCENNFELVPMLRYKDPSVLEINGR